MAQNHSLIPYHKNINNPEAIQVHLIGVIDHRLDCFYGFLTYGNIKNDTNLIIHVMLMVFEDIQKQELVVPEQFAYQIDGASNNHNV
jgi:hypothetical protein